MRRAASLRPFAAPCSAERYFTSTEAPASSSCDLTVSASSWFTPSLTAAGAPSTRSFASLRPRPVTARTTLITWIFCCPAPVSTTSKEVFSSAAAPSPATAPPGAATATGAAAVMPHSSSIFFFSSTSSRTDMLPSCSKTVSTAAIGLFLLGFGFLGFFCRRLVVLHRRALDCGRLFSDGFELRRAAELVDARLDQAIEVLQRGVHEREELRERCDHGAEHLAAQDLERRELRELVDVAGADLLPLQDAAADREHLRVAGGVGERLRDRDHVAVGLDERDRGRPFEQREERLGAGVLGRPASERVLDDREFRTVLEQLAAQIVDLRHRQTAVVGDDQRFGRPEPIGQLGDDAGLVLFLHCTSLRNEPALGRTRRRCCSSRRPPRMDFCPGGLPSVSGDGRVARPKL